MHIVAGPGDPTHRFTYWPVRIDTGGEVIAAGDKTAPVQYIDVRDVAAFTIHTLERNVAGTFNLAGPAASSTPMSHFLEQVKAGTRSSATFTWIDLPFLEQQKVRFLLVLSPDRGPMRGLMKISAAKAMAQGLTFRAITETAADTLAWFRSAPASVQDGLKRDLERDARVLCEWKARG